MATYYTHKDGLTQVYGPRSTTDKAVTRKLNSGGMIQELVVDFDYTHLGSTIATWLDEDASGGSTVDSPSGLHAFVPANATIIDCVLHVKTAFDSAGDSATLTLGFYNSAGTAIDADGIDATVAETAIDAAGDVVVCDGALAANVDVGAANAYIAGIYGTEAFTAGEARLVVRYTPQRA